MKFENVLIVGMFAGVLMLWLGDVRQMQSIQTISEARGDTYSSFTWLWLKIAGALIFAGSLVSLFMFY